MTITIYSIDHLHDQMKKMKLFFYFFLYIFAQGNEIHKAMYDGNEQPRTLVRKKRILGGEVVHDGVGIFMGSVQRRSDRAHLCAGSLITLRHLITTCSCVAHSDDSASGLTSALPEGFIVIAGSKSNTVLDDVNTRNVSRMEADDKCRYDPDAALWEHDIGYITVSRAYNFMDKKLGLVTNLHTSQEALDKDLFALMYADEFQEGGKEFCYVYGWGATSIKKDNLFDVGDTSEQLVHKAVQFVSKIVCKTKLCGISNYVCAYDLEANNCFCMVPSGGAVGPLCFADNGSPLICKDRLYAIGEVANECGVNMKSSLFYKVDIESLKHYILSGTSTVTSNYFLLYCKIVFLFLQ